MYIWRQILEHFGKSITVCSKVSKRDIFSLKTCRPRIVLTPLQLALVVHMHHHFGLKYLTEVLNSLGFCLSYLETQRYESSAPAFVHENHSAFFPGHFTQFIAHNVRTLDGHETFHWIGTIASTTPGYNVDMTIVRKNASIEEMQNLAKVGVKYFTQSNTMEIIPIQFKNIPGALPE